MKTRPRFAVAPVDGSPIFYELSGPPPGGDGRPLLVLSDGIGCDGYIWRHLWPGLSGLPVAHWHYPGHGRTPSPRDPERLSIADFADDLRAVLDDADADRAVLIGHSMGVQVSLETWHRHSDRVAGLVLLCGAPGHPLRTFGGHDLLERALPSLQAAFETAPKFLGRAWRRLVPARLSYDLARVTELNAALVERDELQPYLEGMARIDPRLFLTTLDHANRHDAEPFLSSIDVPTLVIAGDRDGFTPPALSRTMSDAIPESELLMVEGGSHTAPIERPHLVERTILDFLERRLGVVPAPA